MTYARWTTKEEMITKLTPVNNDTILRKVGTPITYDDNYLYISDKEAHNLVIGCTGSGKSLFMLNLSQMLSNRGNVLYISLENTEDQTLDRLESSGLDPNENLYLSHPVKDPNFGINDCFYDRFNNIFKCN